MSEKDSVPQWVIDKRANAQRLCRIFYNAAHRSPVRSCMAFGWECGHGWNGPLAKLSYACETLNLVFYPKYRVRIQADQIKEKYGTLRFYYSVVTDPPAWADILRRAFSGFAEYLRAKVDYDYKTIIDKPRHIRHEFEEITGKEYEKAVNGKYKACNVEYADYGSVKAKVTHYNICAETHPKPSRHRFLHAIMQASDRMSRLLDFRGVFRPCRKQQVVANYLNEKCIELDQTAESECFNVCEICGNQFDKYNPRCETHGYVSYICEKHIKPGVTYVKNGKCYCDGQIIQSEETFNEEEK